MIKKISLTLLCLEMCAFVSAVEISSNNPIEYADDQEELIARGDAKIATEDFIIQADEIKLQKGEAKAIASGNVKIDNGKFYALSDLVSYDLRSNVASAENSKIKIHDYYFHVKNLNLSSDFQSGEDGEIFCGPPDRAFAPSMTVKKFKLSDENFLELEKTKFKFGKVPVFYLASYSSRLSDRKFYFESNFGANHTNGAYLQNDFYFGVHKRLKLGGLLDVYGNRGVLIGPAINFESNSAENQIFVESKFGFIHDNLSRKSRGLDINNHQIGKDRYFEKFVYKQHFQDKLDIISKVAWLSDSEVERDFRKSWYEKEQQPDSFVELAYRGQNHIISAFGQFEPNNFYKTTQRLPEFRFDYLPTKLSADMPIVHNAHLSVTRLFGIPNSERNAAKINSYRTDLYYGAMLPLNYKDFVCIKPIFGMRGLIYDRNTAGDVYSKGLVQGGFDIDFKFTGRSGYTNETFEINGLKHVINPVIQYRVIPSGNVSKSIPKFDTEFFNTELPSIDLDDMRNIDCLPRQNLLRLGVKNDLYTQSGSYVPRKLLSFDIFQDILFVRNYDSYGVRQKRFQDMYVLGGVYPAKWLSFNVFSRFDPVKLNLHELKTSVSINDASFWRATLSSHYSKRRDETIEQYIVGLTFNLSSQTSFSIEEKYDVRLRKFSEQRLSISTVLSGSWLADFGITIRENTRREDRFQFNWHLRLLDF